MILAPRTLPSVAIPKPKISLQFLFQRGVWEELTKNGKENFWFWFRRFINIINTLYGNLELKKLFSSKERDPQKVAKVIKQKGYPSGKLSQGKVLHHIKPVAVGGKTRWLLPRQSINKFIKIGQSKEKFKIKLWLNKTIH